MEMKWIVLALAVLMYVLIVVFSSKKSFFTLGAALLLLLLKVISPREAFFEMVNWHVLMILRDLADVNIYVFLCKKFCQRLVVIEPF